MKKLFLFLAVASTAFFTSCSNDDENNDPVATSIVLAASATTIQVGQSVTLTVTNNLDQNVTASSTFYSNDVALTSATFTPTAAGTYTLRATNGSLVSTNVVVTVNAVAELNSIFFNEENNPVNQSACVFWGGIDLDDDGTVDHAFWSMLVFVGDDITSADPTVSENYIDIEFATPLDAEGNVVFPTTTNVVYLDVYELHLNGSEVVINSQEDGSLTLSEDLTNDITNVTFESTAVLNGTSSMELNYDGSFLGLYNGSGGKYTQPKNSKVTAVSKAQLAKSKAKFFSTLIK